MAINRAVLSERIQPMGECERCLKPQVEGSVADLFEVHG